MIGEPRKGWLLFWISVVDGPTCVNQRFLARLPSGTAVELERGAGTHGFDRGPPQIFLAEVTEIDFFRYIASVA
jgi:hypothetical protein